jgi:hypothetical protein
MRCANHPDRTALGYCSRCGKALCPECLVRLSSGNFCEACANPAPPVRRRTIPRWLIIAAALFVVLLLRLAIH